MAEKDESLLLFREWLDKQFMGLLRLYWWWQSSHWTYTSTLFVLESPGSTATERPLPPPKQIHSSAQSSNHFPSYNGSPDEISFRLNWSCRQQRIGDLDRSLRPWTKGKIPGPKCETVLSITGSEPVCFFLFAGAR
jgi:hypothetical protein